MEDQPTSQPGQTRVDGVPPLAPDLETALYALIDQPNDQHEAALGVLCAQNPAATAALRAAYAAAMATPPDGQQAAPESADHAVRSTPADELLERLRTVSCLDPTRFTIDDNELGRGGMGRVLRVEDGYLRRRVAMKVMLKLPRPRSEDDRRLGRQKLGRFLEEAQVTSQLDHPGVPPVHDIGLDADGEVYFTMRLVRGTTADQVFHLARAGEGGWTRTRALEVLLKVCDTMAFAHDRGVLHRDLKPSNVMVGRFGEVYVMDWGLAKILDQPDSHDLRIKRAPEQAASSPVQSVRKDTDPESESSILTVDGQQLGTPHYMPPEQALGEALDPRSDVYAVGAMLYQLLTGQAPYETGSLRMSPYRILQEVLAGPPKPIHTLVEDVPFELDAICEKAMARERARRYADMPALANDLRAYLDQRTVAAYRTGPVAELRMWVRRNRPLAAALATAIAILLVGVIVVTAQLRSARARKHEFDMLAVRAVLYERAVAREKTLYPPWPDQIAAMEEWLDEDFGKLVRVRPDIVATLEGLVALASVDRADGDTPDRSTWTLDAGLRNASAPGRRLDTTAERTNSPATGVEAPASRRLLRFADDSQRYLYDSLCDLLEKTDALAARERLSVQQRLEWARRVGALTLQHPQRTTTWDMARKALIAADGDVASTLYREHPVDLQPQMGLVPLGMNPTTKLLEFYDLHTAADPQRLPVRNQKGQFDVDEGMGIVFVLVPGGTAWLGAQSNDPGGPNYWVDAKVDEGPPQRVLVPPFLLGRYEMTRGQWRRLTGKDPSYMNIGAEFDGKVYDAAYPVNYVSWSDCTQVLRLEGMRLPTEDEWEFACRALTQTPWYTGDAVTSLAGHANVADETFGLRFNPAFAIERGLTDGWAQDARVGSLEANPFGLHDMHGNMLEWCADEYAPTRFASPRSTDAVASTRRVARGGSWKQVANNLARSAYRHANSASFSESYQGVRAARTLRARM